MAGLRVAVLGAGNIGGTIGKKWLAAGHQVTFAVSNLSGEKAQALRAELGEKAAIGTIAEALAAADVVLLAVPGRAMDEMITTHAAALDGKILIDATLRAQAARAQVNRDFQPLG